MTIYQPILQHDVLEFLEKDQMKQNIPTCGLRKEVADKLIHTKMSWDLDPVEL